jgi:hypothetical protein
VAAHVFVLSILVDCQEIFKISYTDDAAVPLDWIDALAEQLLKLLIAKVTSHILRCFLTLHGN